ncbi:type IV pilus biogenesis protein PilP [Erwinia tasmaniensis]|uniref:Type IV pilus biogenesis protein PilP n=1 Tax=Erwinia tasmaniensis (strain DSM 17950 / CFBP 7177 / CIP 109463 / NCPPB 4357 / Et1/99) TaxID=465817 RepID=B2VAW0_ERWT9|nr:type IV pilus biogenesis protein PilP [Erwinia tasmaniensis]CAO94863.1 Hypothetical protein ETA_pET490210 [Erwinia tasmaniensis Et1/99]
MENAKYAALLLLFCGIAHAEDVKTFGDLDHLQSGRVFYDAQAAFNKAKMAADQPESITVSGLPGNTGEQAPQTSKLPSLEKIAGAVATLSFTDSSSSSQVRAGDSVQGGFTVVSVSMRGVVLKRNFDGHVFTLN